jgi:glycosyltransferase involved in cell wall biosynthesis
MSRPRVVSDGLVFENNYQIGIWRVYYEIIRRLADKADVTLWLRAPAVQPLPPGIRVVRDHGRNFARLWDIPGRLRNRMGRSWPAISARDLPTGAVFHSTYFTPCPGPGCAVVTMVYDMIAERIILTSGADIGIDGKRSAILGATLCLAISHTTAAELKKFYPEVADKIRVVHPGGDHLRVSTSSLVKSDSGSSYVLFVGQRVGYKNFQTVLDAMTCPDWPVGIKLHAAGPELTSHELRLIAAMGLQGRVVGRGRLSDAQLAAEYAGARCFVFPSLLEGFGLPILEAQANRCPLVCSDIPVFREVAADGGIYFDPRLGESLARAVAAAGDVAARRRLVEAGSANLGRFSWDRAAQKTLAVYEEAAVLGCR